MDIVLERILSLLPHKPDGTFVRGAKKGLADKLGLDNAVVSQWFAGKTKSYTKYLYQIAELYGVSVSWLRGDTDDPSPASDPAPASAPTSKEEIRRLLLEAVPGMTDAEVFDLMCDITAAHGNKKGN